MSHDQYYYSSVTDNIRMFSCRWWAWTAELRTRTKQSYPCSSRNLNPSSWVRSQRHGHLQKSFLDVFAILYSWYCASAFYIPIYWRLLPISISMQTHISLFCTLAHIYLLCIIVMLIALYWLQSSPIFVLQEYSLWRCAPRYLLWASFAMRTRTSGIVNAWHTV